MRAFDHLAAKDHADVPELLHVAASVLILIGAFLTIFVCAQAMSAPIAGWASAQTAASLAPV